MSRPSRLNFTPSLRLYTTTIEGRFHRLGKDKAAAEAQFRFLLGQADRGVETDPSIAFSEVADAYLGHIDGKCSVERFRSCQQRLQELKDRVGDDFPARNLRPRHIDGWLAGRELAGGTERLYKCIVLACLNWAAKPISKKGGGLIAENPLRGQLLMPAGSSRGGEAVWSPAVFEQVTRQAHPTFADLVRILAWTGARPSTVRRIEARHYNQAQKRWDCEDLYRGRASAAKYVVHVRLLSAEARELVERLNAKHPEGPIFRNSRGEPWRPYAPQIYLTGLRNKYAHSKGLEWPDSLCVYGLRHTFATNFLRQFPNEIEYLRVLLGHKDYKMIHAHYSHLIDQHAEAFKRLDGFTPFKPCRSTGEAEVASAVEERGDAARLPSA